MEQLQLEVESLMYTQDEEQLKDVIGDLDIASTALTGKSRVQVIKLIIKAIDSKLEEEGDSAAKIAFLKEIRATLVDEPPPLEMDETEKEMLALEQQYAELKLKREQEMKEIESKLAELKKKMPQTTTKEAHTSDEIQITDSGKTKEMTFDIGSSVLRREFKISGQIGEPGQTDKLTFVSLTHQIDSGLKRGYKERDLVDAIIRSISPHSSLRSYVETLPALSLAKLRKILRVHYREKTASELYQQLATAYQQPKETPQQFLLRALDVRNKVSFASQEVDCEINYDFPLIQKTFLKSFETGLRDDILATNLRPTLRNPGLSDEDLMKQVNELASHQAERQSKLGTNAHQRTSKVSAASVGLDQERGQVSLQGDTCRASDSVQLLAEIREIKSDLNALKQTVRERDGNGRGQGRANRQGQQRRGCRSCKEKGTGDSCQHCFSCGRHGHLATHCYKNQRGPGNGRQLFPRDAE